MPRSIAGPLPHGFALVEAVIIMLLVAALAGVGFHFARLLGEAAAQQETSRMLEDAREALLGYAQSHGHLPCPAPAMEEQAGGAGLASQHVGADCALGYAGHLPSVTLGLRRSGRGHVRLLYRVVPEFANAVNECDGARDPARSICVTPTAASPWPAHRDALEVRDRRSSGPDDGHTSIAANNLALVLIARPARGGAAAAVDPVTRDAGRNAHPATVSFIRRERTSEARSCSDVQPAAPACAFEDRLLWVSRGELLRRLVIADRVR